jgi:hypothetical protein
VSRGKEKEGYGDGSKLDVAEKKTGMDWRLVKHDTTRHMKGDENKPQRGLDRAVVGIQGWRVIQQRKVTSRHDSQLSYLDGRCQ